ncbi:hypothetical protein V9T40_008915 [Parthenolecanium corni]|uniref:K Homology domain-containing protein n=1 Tax=Parthenolecanium corni TaxID=536013 RepID=A0AAN9Y7M4_9HEMI
MDILNPDIELIDGCHYRINPIDGYSFGKNVENLPYQEYNDEEEEDEDKFGNETVQEEDDEIPNLVLRDDGFYVTKVHVARVFLPVLIGKRGTTQQRLERETKAFIRIPRKEEKEEEIKIRSKRKENVAAAYRRIQIMVDAARRKHTHTHFISIPLTNERIKKRFIEFKNSVLENFSSDRGICEDAFLKPEKLHLTVVVMTLVDNFERHVAINTLHRFKESYFDSAHLNEPIKIRVQGLEIMNDDPSDARVLYAKVSAENNSLQQLVDDIAKFFSTAGLTCASRESVKLHATLMNARFLSLRTTGIEDRNKTFDVRNILKNFENYDFGEVLVNSILLSQSHSADEDGYYSTSTKIILGSSDKTA